MLVALILYNVWINSILSISIFLLTRYFLFSSSEIWKKTEFVVNCVLQLMYSIYISEIKFEAVHFEFSKKILNNLWTEGSFEYLCPLIHVRTSRTSLKLPTILPTTTTKSRAGANSSICQLITITMSQPSGHFWGFTTLVYFSAGASNRITCGQASRSNKGWLGVMLKQWTVLFVVNKQWQMLPLKH